MLWWITYIKSLNSEIQFLFGKDNAMVDMLFKARVTKMKRKESIDDDDELDFFKRTPVIVERAMYVFKEDKYEDKWLLTGRFLSTLMVD